MFWKPFTGNWDTEGYIEMRAIFVQFLKGLPSNELRRYTGSFALSAR